MQGQMISIPTLWHRHRALTLFALFALAAFAVCAALRVLDDRMLQGVSVWSKPMKFQLSMTVYFLTFAWFIGNLTDQARRGIGTALIAWGVILSGSFEVVYITWQAAVGAQSHFNFSSVFHITMYQLMGVGALLLTCASIALSLRVRAHSVLQPGAYRTGVVWGLMITGLMGIVTGVAISANNGHWIGGAPTDAGGLPFFGWVLDGGDLRPPHFFALHALQILPAFGLVIGAVGLDGHQGQRPDGARLVRIMGIAYGALILALMVLAYQGKSVASLF